MYFLLLKTIRAFDGMHPGSIHPHVSSIQVEAGLYTLCYVGSKYPGSEPTVFVQVSSDSREDIDLISAPQAEPGVLDGPGDCLVVRAIAPGALDVSVAARMPGLDDAELRLEPLSRKSAAPVAPRRDGMVAGTGIEVTGHVSRRGDVSATRGSWIAGPEAPARIEGVSARLAGDDGGVEYQVLVGGPGGQWSDWARDGAFAGSRGQHRPLLGLRMRLIGAASRTHELKVDALFLGAPVKTSNGARIDLTSDSGLEPLVGLRIAAIPRRSGAELPKAHPSIRAQAAREDGFRRIRVFRAPNSGRS